MESLLLIVTMVALSLGAIMSVVAWRLLRNTHARSAARVDALRALALGGDAAEIVDAPAPRIMSTDEDGPDDSDWDLTLRRTDDDDPPVVTPGPPARPVPARTALTVSPAAAARVIDRQPAAARAVIRHATPVHDLSPAIFGSDTASPAPSRRWLVVAAVIGVMVLGAAAAYALRAGNFFGAITNAVAASREVPPLELLSLRHVTDEAGNFTVTGLVQNPQTGHALRGVVAVIYLFDQHGRFLSSGRAAIEVPAFQPGDESPFVVKVPSTSGVTRYRVGFRYTDGGVVAHVDKRGQLPGGTMENTAEPAQHPPSAPTPLGPRGSEG